MSGKKYAYLVLFVGPILWILAPLQASASDWAQKEVTRPTRAEEISQKIAFEKEKEDLRREKARLDIIEAKAAAKRLYETEVVEYPHRKARYGTHQLTLSGIAEKIAMAVAEIKRQNPRFAFKVGLELFTKLRTNGLEMIKRDVTAAEVKQFEMEILDRSSKLQGLQWSIQPSNGDETRFTYNALEEWRQEYNNDNKRIPSAEAAYQLMLKYYLGKISTVGKGYQCALGFLYSLLFQCGTAIDQDALGKTLMHSERICHCVGGLCGIGVGAYAHRIPYKLFRACQNTDEVDFVGLCYSCSMTKHSRSYLCGPHLAIDHVCSNCSCDCSSDTPIEPQHYEMSKVLDELGLGEPKVPTYPK